MSRTLEAKVIFEIADHEGTEDWKVNQDVLVQLRHLVEAMENPHVVGEPKINKLHASTKTEA